MMKVTDLSPKKVLEIKHLYHGEKDKTIGMSTPKIAQVQGLPLRQVWGAVFGLDWMEKKWNAS